MSDSPPLILIVDDDVQNRKLLRAMLKPEGYATVSAGSGQKALEVVKQRAPDLILLDVLMPDKNGYEVARTLKDDANTSSIPIIMVTVDTDQRAMMDGLKAGAEEFLTKPINRPELWLRVRNLLRLKEMRDLLNAQNERLEREVEARTAKLQRFRKAMDATGDAIVLVDKATERFVEVNATASKMFGYSREEFLGLGTESQEATTQIELERLRDAILGGPPSEQLMSIKIRRKDGWHLPVEIVRQTEMSDEDSITVGVVRDITEREEAHLRLYRMAHHDPLTGLPNRTLFYETLSKTLTQAERHNWEVAVLYVDLDHFKRINDTHGHAMGDVLLGRASERLLRCVRIRDTVGRLGGDEFAVILLLTDRQKGATFVAGKIREALRAPFTLGGYQVSVTASVGIAFYPDDGKDPESLIKYADMAMYRAKQSGRDAHRLFDPQMNVELLTQLSLEAALRQAIENQEFVIHYQPKVEAKSGRITGLEALLRWDRPGHGLVAPKYFIPALEETGLIIQVGNWVIAAVCEQIKSWSHSSIGPRHVSVNVSARQFVDHDLHNDVNRALCDSGIDAALLELELTESSLMVNTEATTSALRLLKNRGVQLSIDDFGTGYSSLAYLQRFPIDTVKIDITFVRSLTGRTGEATIAKTIIKMAHSLKMKAVAEGVETAEQHSYLLRNGCDELQGYYYSHPLPLADIETLLQRDEPLLRPPSD
jgi:diguanylate cyclase (GGDEF)-like protein/PAS domain S-box-containing protein